MVEIPIPTPEKAKPKPKRYESKEGFIVGKMLRGRTQIEPILELCQVAEWPKNSPPKYVYTLCGGYMRWACSPLRHPTPAADIDIYSWDEGSFEYMKRTFANKNNRFSLELKHENGMALTYRLPKDRAHPLYHCPKVQLIKPVIQGKIVAMGGTREILENFDFTVVRVGATSASVANNQILMDADFMHDEEHRILRLKNIHCPISSTLRCMKYAKKGYWLSPFQTLRLFMDWDNRGDDYRSKLMKFLEEAEGKDGLTQEEVDEMEAMMRID